MTKKPKPKAAKQQVDVAYKAPHGSHTVPLKVPVAPGHGEQIINDAEKHGCTDIPALRQQIAKHY